MIWYHYTFIIWVLFVIGGWCNLRPVPARKLRITWRLIYILPTNLFYFVDRVANVTVFTVIIWLVPAWRRQSPTKWETISSRVGRDFKHSPAHIFIDILALDWSTEHRTGHCLRYVGT